MLIRRQLNTLKDLVAEYQLTVDATLVPLTLNIADQLTRVPHRWFNAMGRGNGPGPLIGAIHVDELDTDQIMSIYRNSGHPGVWRTTYFVKRVCLPIKEAAVISTIQVCEECQSAPIHWEKGKLEVNGN